MTNGSESTAGLATKSDGLPAISAESTRRIKDAINSWLVARDGFEDSELGQDVETDPVRAAELEAELHALLRAEWPGVRMLFAGLVVWADAGTPAGRVASFPVVEL